MSERKRRLSAQQAKACEEAKRPLCVCRCGGTLHGQSHQSWIAAERVGGPMAPGDPGQLPLPQPDGETTTTGVWDK